MTTPRPDASQTDPSRVVASLARDQVNLELKTIDLCFLAALYLKADKAALASFEEDMLIDMFEQVCDFVEPSAENPRKRATHANQRLREQRMLARVDGAGLVRAGDYALTTLAAAVVQYFLADEALTRDSLTLLTGTLSAQLAEVLADAKKATSSEAWHTKVSGRLRVTVSDAESHRAQHAQVMGALSVLVEGDVAVDAAYDAALSALQEHRRRTDLAERLPRLERTLEDARKKAERQARVRERASALRVVLGDEPAGRIVEGLLNEAETTVKEHEDEERAARASAVQLEREMKELDARRQALVDREPTFRDLSERAARLTTHLSTPVKNRATLDAARSTLDGQLASARKAEDAAREEREVLLQQARNLVAHGGPFSPDLLELKDQLGADLVAGSFEDVGLDEAALLEARLGPLAHALVVDDPEETARSVDGRSEALSDVLLVSRDADLERIASAPSLVDVSERGVLFDLCQTLDLQLLIAAPEVARAEGNTTYRLVRKVTSDGREDVMVSGRRTRAEA